MSRQLIIIAALLIITSGTAFSQNEKLLPESPTSTETASSETIPETIVSFDSEENTYALVVEKQTQQLFVFDNHGAEIYRLTCSTGKSLGAKMLSGDSKTPEGVYFFIKIHEKEELAPIYGIRAFPTDYPNLLDQIAERTGNAIWLHGTNKQLKPRDSNGCIVLEDADVEKLTALITLNRTPIIIAKKISYEPFAPEIKQSLLTLISNWNTALETGTYHDYVRFYDAEYVPDITWWTEWNKLRKFLQKSENTLSVASKDLLMVRYGEIYVLLFEQILKFSDRDISAGLKKIFLAYKDGQFSIIGEGYQMPSEPEQKETPFITAARELKTKPIIAAARSSQMPSSVQKKDDTDNDEINAPEIEEMIEGWIRAWSSKNIDEYGAYYAGDFQSQGKNKTAWLAYKERLNQKYDYIRVSKDNLKVKKDKGLLIASFVQHYESDKFKSVSIKQLVLIRENNEWKIYRETSRKR